MKKFNYTMNHKADEAYLIDSICVDDALKLIINVKGSVSVTEELYQKEA